MGQPRAESPIRSALKDLEASEVFELRDEVAALKDSRPWEAIMRLLDLGRDRVADAVFHGPTLEQAAYARNAGYVSGLDTLLSMTEVIEKEAGMRESAIQAKAEGQAKEAAR
jgi:hypothetical protein